MTPRQRLITRAAETGKRRTPRLVNINSWYAELRLAAEELREEGDMQAYYRWVFASDRQISALMRETMRK